jgi:hypothetical protein
LKNGRRTEDGSRMNRETGRAAFAKAAELREDGPAVAIRVTADRENPTFNLKGYQ